MRWLLAVVCVHIRSLAVAGQPDQAPDETGSNEPWPALEVISGSTSCRVSRDGTCVSNIDFFGNCTIRVNINGG